MKSLRIALLALTLTACPGGAPEDDTESSKLICPPCGMTMAADSELTEVAGHQFAFCNERCKELVSKSPEQFLGHGIAIEAPAADSAPEAAE